MHSFCSPLLSLSLEEGGSGTALSTRNLGRQATRRRGKLKGGETLGPSDSFGPSHTSEFSVS